jgi:hypothetical protein
LRPRSVISITPRLIVPFNACRPQARGSFPAFDFPVDDKTFGPVLAGIRLERDHLGDLPADCDLASDRRRFGKADRGASRGSRALCQGHTLRIDPANLRKVIAQDRFGHSLRQTTPHHNLKKYRDVIPPVFRAGAFFLDAREDRLDQAVVKFWRDRRQRNYGSGLISERPRRSAKTFDPKGAKLSHDAIPLP